VGIVARDRSALRRSIVIGVLAFGALLFTLLARFLPMQEPEAH